MKSIHFYETPPQWTRKHGITDNTLALLQSASMLVAVQKPEEVETYVKDHADAGDAASVLNAINEGKNKGYL